MKDIYIYIVVIMCRNQVGFLIFIVFILCIIFCSHFIPNRASMNNVLSLIVFGIVSNGISFKLIFTIMVFFIDNFKSLTFGVVEMFDPLYFVCVQLFFCFFFFLPLEFSCLWPSNFASKNVLSSFIQAFKMDRYDPCVLFKICR